MSKPKTKNPRVGFSWGILLGMSGIPILALMSKVFPKFDMAWEVSMVLCGLVVARCVYGYLVAGSPASIKKSEQAAH